MVPQVVVVDPLEQERQAAAQVGDDELDARVTRGDTGTQKVEYADGILERRTDDLRQPVIGDLRGIEISACRVDEDGSGSFVERRPIRLESWITQGAPQDGGVHGGADETEVVQRSGRLLDHYSVAVIDGVQNRNYGSAQSLWYSRDRVIDGDRFFIRFK